MVAVMSLREAAVVAAVSPKVIRHCLEQEVVKPARKNGRWCFSGDDALFFALRDAIPFDIDVEDQRALYALVTRHKKHISGWKLIDEGTLELGTDRVRVHVDFSRIRHELERRLELLAKRDTRIVSRPDTLGGEPVFAGTRVSARHVGLLMLRGVPMEQMRVDFPRLAEEDFELAKLLALIGPKPGRPRRLPPLRFLRDGKASARDPT